MRVKEALIGAAISGSVSLAGVAIDANYGHQFDRDRQACYQLPREDVIAYCEHQVEYWTGSIETTVVYESLGLIGLMGFSYQAYREIAGEKRAARREKSSVQPLITDTKPYPWPDRENL